MAEKKSVSEFEHENLALHVEMCSMRYNSLDKRLTNIETKVEAIYTAMTESRNSLNKVIIGSAGTVVAGLLSTIIVLLMKVH
jgi:tetrahydromethanopterin S-methyltransferase subunit G